MRQIGVIGVGRFGTAVARRLTEKGVEVTAMEGEVVLIRCEGFTYKSDVDEKEVSNDKEGV